MTNLINCSDYFLEQYKQMLLENYHDRSKVFNKNLQSFKYFVIHPHIDLDGQQVVIGFTNDDDKFDKTTVINNSYHIESITAGVDFVSYENQVFDIDESIVIPTNTISPIPVREVSWDKLINSPSIGKGDFSELKSPFIEYWNIDEHSYNDLLGNIKYWDAFFNKQPESVELRTVWEDTDSLGKYGHIQTLIFWHDEFIGWYTASERYLSTYSYYVVNKDRWISFMNFLKELSGLVILDTIKGVKIIDMSTDSVDNVAFVPGISERNYGEYDE